MACAAIDLTLMQAGLTIGAVMGARAREFSWIKPEELVSGVLARLEFENRGALIVSRNGRKLRGLITDRDLIRGMRYYGPEVFELEATVLMQDNVLTCDVSDPAAHAAQLLGRPDIRHLPILDRGELAGLVTIHDLLAWQDNLPV
jgi:CBS domain-containing protein